MFEENRIYQKGEILHRRASDLLQGEGKEDDTIKI